MNLGVLPGDEAVNSVGAWPAATFVERPEVETIQEVLTQDEAHLKQGLEDDVEDVGP